MIWRRQPPQRSCDVCHRPVILDGSEHSYHACLAGFGCDCDLVAHPACCPTCRHPRRAPSPLAARLRAAHNQQMAS